MQRRKFLIGAGSLAAAGAAAMGSGAFTQVDAEREVSINVVGDSEAYLRLDPEQTENADEYVNTSGDTLSFNFPNVNDRADSKFSNLFAVKNEGTQAVRVGVDMDSSNLPSGFGIFCEGTPGDGSLGPDNAIQPASSDPGSHSGYTYSSATGGGFDAWDDPVHLEVGEWARGIGFAWDLNDVDSDDDNDLDDDLNGDWSIDIRAQDLDYDGV